MPAQIHFSKGAPAYYGQQLEVINRNLRAWLQNVLRHAVIVFVFVIILLIDLIHIDHITIPHHAGPHHLPRHRAIGILLLALDSSI